MVFKEGQIIWLLETPTAYRRTPKEYISKCIYRGQSFVTSSEHGVNVNIYHSIQRENPDGSLGMTFSVSEKGESKIFSTLQELKDYIIGFKLNDISNQQLIINNINSEIDEIKSMKDISEDREVKLNTLLQWN